VLEFTLTVYNLHSYSKSETKIFEYKNINLHIVSKVCEPCVTVRERYTLGVFENGILKGTSGCKRKPAAG
jgi:hypothetical protein